MPCGLPAGTFKAFGAWNALRAANPQVLSRHLVLGMPLGAANPQVFSRYLVLGTASTLEAFGAWNALRLPTRRYFQGFWCLECHAGCQPADTFKAFGAWNALRAANPQVLSRHLVLEMPCGLPTRRYFQGIWCLKCPAGCQPAGTFKAFGAWNALRAAKPQVLSRHLVLEMPCGLPTRRYFQGIWCLKCPAGCQPVGTFKAFGAWNALRAAKPQVLSRHLVLEVPCGLPTRRYFQDIWCLKCPAGCQPAGTFKAFGAWNALRAVNPQVLSKHLMLEMPCGLPIRRFFQGIWCLECLTDCQSAGTFKAFGA